MLLLGVNGERMGVVRRGTAACAAGVCATARIPTGCWKSIWTDFARFPGSCSLAWVLIGRKVHLSARRGARHRWAGTPPVVADECDRATCPGGGDCTSMGGSVRPASRPRIVEASREARGATRARDASARFWQKAREITG